MHLKSETQSRMTAEIGIVPLWAWVLAGIIFVAPQIFFSTVVARQHNAPPEWGRVLMGLGAGIVGGCYLLFIGYINRDAKRRGMSPTLWTFVAILIPNALGILLYFILRQSLRSSCPQCGKTVEAGFNFCPGCNYKLSPNCQQCQRVVGANDVYCPYCGTSLRKQETAPAAY